MINIDVDRLIRRKLIKVTLTTFSLIPRTTKRKKFVRILYLLKFTSALSKGLKSININPYTPTTHTHSSRDYSQRGKLRVNEMIERIRDDVVGRQKK